VRAGSRTLESDLAYTRYLGQGWYRYGRGRHSVVVSGMAGSLTGDAPLFERFSLGNSITLRGWDKYDVAPLGGERMVYSSLEYQYRGLGLFLDSGSVWDRDTERRFRVATGISFNPGPLFFTVGFPLNADNVSAVFTMGIRVSAVGIQK
jgi:outer membrane translocation and assembly module TamA